MRRRPDASIMANPLLTGTCCVLVTLVAVFVTYNANNGLPFVPTYNVTAMVRDAQLLGHNAEVRIGGKRVGMVTNMEAVPTKSGEPVARLSMKIDIESSPLPVDTKVRVRPKSVIGLKYLELEPGKSKKMIKAGGVIPVRNHLTSVDLQDALNAFDDSTRRHFASTTVELGDGFAGRGASLNQAIRSFNPLLRHLRPVMENVADPRTDLDGFFRGLDSAAGAVEPVSAQLGGLFDGAATTLHALARERDAFGRLIDETPETERVATEALRASRPVLDDATELVDDLRPGVRVLPQASTRLARAVEVGTPVLRRADSLADRLNGTMGALRTLLRDPATSGSVIALTSTLETTIPTLRFLNPAQTRCNLLGLYFRNAPSVIGEGDENGNWFRFLPLNNTPDNPYQGDVADNLHFNAYGWDGPDSRCIAGNEKYEPGQHIGPPPNAGSAPMTNPTTKPPAEASR
jgi:virulence factor Mce-like protein